jgi:hypothetical protein
MEQVWGFVIERNHWNSYHHRLFATRAVSGMGSEVSIAAALAWFIHSFMSSCQHKPRALNRLATTIIYYSYKHMTCVLFDSDWWKVITVWWHENLVALHSHCWAAAHICFCIASRYACLSNVCLPYCILSTLSWDAVQLHPKHKSKTSFWDDWLYVISYWYLADPLHRHYPETPFNSFLNTGLRRHSGTIDCMSFRTDTLQTPPSAPSGYRDIVVRPIGNTSYLTSTFLGNLTFWFQIIMSLHKPK